MKPILVAPLIALAAAAAQAGKAEVNFVEPRSYRDSGRSAVEAERIRAELTGHLARLAEHGLSADRVLAIDVLDIDLAGEPRLATAHDDQRVLRGRADWPRIELRYALWSGKQVLASGQEVVQDMAYMDHSLAPALTEPLVYEKRMLTRWFAERFTAAPH